MRRGGDLERTEPLSWLWRKGTNKHKESLSGLLQLFTADELEFEQCLGGYMFAKTDAVIT